MKIKTNQSIILIFFTLTNLCCAQVSVKSKQSVIIAEKWKDSELTIPIEIEFKKSGTIRYKISFDSTIKTVKVDEEQKLNLSQLSLIKINKGAQDFVLETNEITKTFYLIIDKTFSLQSNNEINIDTNIKLDSTTSTIPIKIILKPANDLTYTLTDYLNDNNLKLKYVSKVESNNNILNIYGTHRDNSNNIIKRQVALKENEVYGVVNVHANFYKPSISLITVPFKIRPKQSNLNTVASSGLTNVGLNIDFLGRKWDRYFISGTKSQQKLAVGAWVAPAVEELDSISTNSYLKKDVKSKQLFISTGLTIMYSYNNINFVFVPIGFDFATSNVGKEWVYNKKRWLGFGIGIDPKIFGSIANK